MRFRKETRVEGRLNSINLSRKEQEVETDNINDEKMAAGLQNLFAISGRRVHEN
jgi:hypothetical protein